MPDQTILHTPLILMRMGPSPAMTGTKGRRQRGPAKRWPGDRVLAEHRLIVLPVADMGTDRVQFENRTFLDGGPVVSRRQDIGGWSLEDQRERDARIQVGVLSWGATTRE